MTKELETTYHIIKCENAEDVLAQLDEQNVNLIASDFNILAMDGFLFCILIKTSIAYSHIPIILHRTKRLYHPKLKGSKNSIDSQFQITVIFFMAYTWALTPNFLRFG